MSFGLTITPSTVQRMMNIVLQPTLGKFAMAYVDTFSYSRELGRAPQPRACYASTASRAQPVCQIFQVPVLSYVSPLPRARGALLLVSADGIHIDPKKTAAIATPIHGAARAAISKLCELLSQIHNGLLTACLTALCADPQGHPTRACVMASD
jgi:hypothetical protein